MVDFSVLLGSGSTSSVEYFFLLNRPYFHIWVILVHTKCFKLIHGTLLVFYNHVIYSPRFFLLKWDAWIYCRYSSTIKNAIFVTVLQAWFRKRPNLIELPRNLIFRKSRYFVEKIHRIFTRNILLPSNPGPTAWRTVTQILLILFFENRTIFFSVFYQSGVF